MSPHLRAVAEQTIRNAWHAPIPVPPSVVAANLEAAWRDACTIETREQLDALPAQSVIQSDASATGDGNPWTWERFDEGWFTTAFSPAGVPDLPARLLWHPDWGNRA